MNYGAAAEYEYNSYYHYIYGDNGVVALHIVDAATPRAANMYYIHTDHLGSYCAITDAKKSVVQHNYFDPWGNFRLIYEKSSKGIGLPPEEPQVAFPINFTLTYRGFTGHEHYTYFKIINMNGRLYDPVIGRFFSPDKFVANSSFTQDFNRYSYARNNPLMYTDPDGELVWFAPLIAIGISAAIAAASYTIQVAVSPGGFQNWNWNDFGFNMMIGVGMGMITSGIGGAFGAVGSLGVLGEIGRAGAHALTSGMFSEVLGGNFWQGAAAGAFSSLVGSATAGMPIAAQIGYSTLAGGVASKRAGGKFWQGAVNGLMVSSLNHAMHAVGKEVEMKKNLEAKMKAAGFVTSLQTGMVGGAADVTLIETAGELNISVKELKQLIKAAAIGDAQALKIIKSVSTGARILGLAANAVSAVASYREAQANPSAENWAKFGVSCFIGTLNLLDFVYPGLGTSLSLGATIIEMNGGFDWFYNNFK